MKVLLVEDDDMYAEVISEALKGSFAQVKLVRISTEHEFRRQLAGLATGNFDVAIFDIMIRWGDVEDLSDAPSDVKEEAEGKRKWRAGVRCRQLFNEALAKQKAKLVPSFYHSVLDAQDLVGEINGEAELVVKQGNIEQLIDKVRQVTQRPKP
jgi:CheY-like chemotaxis protein